MKIRLLCLALCVLMALPLAMTGCSSGEDDTAAVDAASSANAQAMTITLYSITNKSTTDEAIALVEEKLNSITRAEFNTNLILRLVTESEYKKLIEEKRAAIEEQLALEAAEAEAKKAAEKAAREAAKTATGTTTKAKTEETESSLITDETIINAYGIEEVVYPEENGTQLDILLINDIDMLQEYVADGLLTALDEQLSIGSKILNKYIHPTFLSAAKVGKKTYAIPNYHVVGEYQYLLLNRSLIDKYYYNPDNMIDIADLEDYLRDLVKYEKGVVPMLATGDLLRTEYILGEESLIGTVDSRESSLGTDAAPGNLFGKAGYTGAKMLIDELTASGAIVTKGSLTDKTKYGAAIISGDATTPEQYEKDYYVNVYKYPIATTDNIYSGMYAISKYAADPARCMEIITYLTTNEEFINIFQYGVEGEHYEIDEATGLVKKKGNSYSMNSEYTGNQFLMKPSTDMSPITLKLAENNWAIGKLQNLDMVYSPYLGFTLQYDAEVEVETGKFEEDGKTPIMKTEVQDLVIGAETDAAVTVKEVAKQLKSLTTEYLKKLKEFKEYEETYMESYYVYAEDGVTIVEAQREAKRMVTLDDYISKLSEELAANKYVVAATNAEDPNSLVSQYTTWHKKNFG